MQAADIGRYSN